MEASPQAVSAGSLPALYVHPLVLVSMSDHSLRASATAPASAGAASSAVAPTVPREAVGILFGRQSGSRVEVFTSSDVKVLPPDADSTIPRVDAAFIKAQIELITAVFPAYELLGWYAVTAAAAPAAHHADLHAQFSQFNETPVFLHMHTGAVDPNSSDLPVRAYLAQYAASGNSWMACPFRVDTTHTETSALHHTLTEAQSGVGSSDDPRMTQLRATASALAMLDERLSGLVSFVSDVQSGAVPPTTAARACLRDISALLARIPIVSPSPPAHAGDGHALPHAGGAAAASSPAATFAGARATDRADTAVLSLLASVTHSASLLQTVTDKLSAVHADAARAAWEAGDRLSGVWSGDGEGGGRERLGGLGGGALGWRGGRGDRMDPMWREGPGGRERYMGAMGPMGHMGDMGGMLASLTGAGGGGMGMGGGRYDERERDRERSAGSRRKRDVGKS